MAAASFDALRDAIRAHRPAVLVTVVDGPGAGDKLLLVEGDEPAGSLADPDLDRVVRARRGRVAGGGRDVGPPLRRLR